MNDNSKIAFVKLENKSKNQTNIFIFNTYGNEDKKDANVSIQSEDTNHNSEDDFDDFETYSKKECLGIETYYGSELKSLLTPLVLVWGLLLILNYVVQIGI